ncbi:MAG: hypothetical protein K6G65_02825 [Lachnospiraceae bacterium]|nr:hypothetical protein [Lachnospiraceae bacterium]
MEMPKADSSLTKEEIVELKKRYKELNEKGLEYFDRIESGRVTKEEVFYKIWEIWKESIVIKKKLGV